MIPAPLELLEEKLTELEKAKTKSTDSFNEKKISEEEHTMHLHNLEPKISEYKFAIAVLKSYDI